MNTATDDTGAEQGAESMTFQAEIQQLLHLLSESLYQNREITIRELVSNASDALDKHRYHCVTSGADPGDLQITIDPDKENRILVIRDNGIGMTRDDLIANLGTIARSGSKEFVKALQDSDDKSRDVSLIGQFGVGFYSAFMLADEVEVRTHHADDSTGWSWKSNGDGTFRIAELPEQTARGTEIRLHLKKDLDEFTDPTRLKFILRKYSTFVPHPIRLDDEHVNDQKPIWQEPKSTVTDEQYQQFFEYLTHFPGQKPQWHLHLSADSPFEFRSILYCPDTNLEKIGFGRTEHGLHLCAKRILVQNDNRDLLPEYLRFIRGIVDSADLPLNVSREALQDNTVFRKMRKVLVKKVLDHLDTVASDSPDDYESFYREFGMILREGINSDYDNQDRLAGLLRFSCTDPDLNGKLVSLAGYCNRAEEDQKQIYFVTGTDVDNVLRDPNLEVFRDRELEVLVLTDPVDEFVLSALGQFDGRDIVSIDSTDLKLPGDADDSSADDEESDDKTDSKNAISDDAPEGFAEVLNLFRDALGDQVSGVRQSSRLTQSACSLVNPTGKMSTTMERVLQMQTPDHKVSKMILEINPGADLISRLCTLSKNDGNADFIRECGRQLHANAMVSAGLAPNVTDMQQRVQSFMLELAQQRSSIVT